VVWGGCLNHVYSVTPGADVQGADGYRTAPGEVVTLHQYLEKQDWVFAKAPGGGRQPEVVRSPATKAFFEASKRRTAATGQPPSDHFAEAVCIRAPQTSL